MKKASKKANDSKQQRPDSASQEVIDAIEMLTQASKDENKGRHDFSAMSMDGTSVTEISFMVNDEYSRQIVEDTLGQYNLKDIQDMKSSNLDVFYKEAKKQIIGLWEGIEALMAHTSMFVVRFLIAMGMILNEVESSFEKKGGLYEMDPQTLRSTAPTLLSASETSCPDQGFR